MGKDRELDSSGSVLPKISDFNVLTPKSRFLTIDPASITTIYAVSNMLKKTLFLCNHIVVQILILSEPTQSIPYQ